MKEYLKIYQEVLNQERKSFPSGFWKQEKSKEIAKVCVKYLIEDYLKWDETLLKEHFKSTLFREYKLKSMVDQLFEGKAFQVLDYVYPNTYKAWDFISVPKNYWNEKTAKEALKWVIEEKLHLSKEDILKQYSLDFLKRHNIFGAALSLFDGKIYPLLDLTYPCEFKEWQLKDTPKNYWTYEKAQIATKWLIEDQLKWNQEEVYQHLSYQIFKQHGLAGMLQGLFQNSPYLALNNAYPDVYSIWLFRNVPRHYWNEETGIQAVKWLIEEKLHLSEEDLKKANLSMIFKENGLNRLIKAVFHDSPYLAIHTAYPNRFKAWELKSVPKNYWNKKTGIEAMVWLLKDELKLQTREEFFNIDYPTIKKYGLYSMIKTVFECKITLAVQESLPFLIG